MEGTGTTQMQTFLNKIQKLSKVKIQIFLFTEIFKTLVW